MWWNSRESVGGLQRIYEHVTATVSDRARNRPDWEINEINALESRYWEVKCWDCLEMTWKNTQGRKFCFVCGRRKNFLHPKSVHNIIERKDQILQFNGQSNICKDYGSKRRKHNWVGHTLRIPKRRGRPKSGERSLTRPQLLA